ncbi:MAG TPA: ABC transporter ATP-binding protein [Opitutaceae bacterium]
MPAAVELQQLTKDFRTGWLGRRRRAVDGIYLTIPTGAVCALIGPNGSGKSTTIKLLLGLLTPTAGACRVLGSSPTEVAVRRRMGYVPESAVWPEQVTAREWVDLAARLSGLSGVGVKAAVDAALDAVDLGACADRRIGTYSKGQRQRVELAQAIVHGPELLILDEPAEGLDPESAALCVAIMARQRARGGTVLIASHQFDVLESVCDHVAILGRGRLCAAGPLATLARNSERAPTFAIEAASSSLVDELQAWLDARGARLRPLDATGQHLGALYRETLGAEPGRASR